jgi:Ca2+-binding RTX toxin-like protein
VLTGTAAVSATGTAQDDNLQGFLNSAANNLIGGAGNDTYYVGGNDVVIETDGQGQDVVYTFEDYSLALGSSVEYLVGGASTGMRLTGNELNNIIWGTAFNDTLNGGAGADMLTGGLGADTFVFTSIGDSGVGAGNRDIIADFVSGTDKIDFSGIDAIAGTSANDNFTFISTNAFSGSGASGAGQLRYFVDGGNTIIEGDVDGNGLADFQVQLTGVHTFTTTDLLL